ncbi:MAG: hypothetical protein HQK82_12805 [Desulfovibrionaceae bacterium]|nr:hypothetical protein [Desulfovibrionaceae bacterium]
MNLAEVYQRVNGKPATNEDLARIVKMANALDVAGQDTFLCLLVVFDHYHGLYDGIPAKITEGTKNIVAQAEKLAEADLKRLHAQAEAEIASAIQGAAEKSAAAAGARTMIAWIGSGLIVMALVVGALAYWLNDRAYQAGYQAGTVELAKLQGFQATEEFRLAAKLHERGELNPIVTCTVRGWAIDKNGTCHPGTYDRDGKEYYSGWKMPDYKPLESPKSEPSKSKK